MRYEQKTDIHIVSNNYFGLGVNFYTFITYSQIVENS